MAYTPPTSPLSFEFSVSYTPETSPLSFIFIEGSVQYVSPDGIDSLEAGGGTVYNQSQFVSISGVSSSEVGGHTVATDQFVYASGLGTEEFGAISLAYDQLVTMSSGETAAFGQVRISRQLSFDFQVSGYTPENPLDFNFLGDSQGVLVSGSDHSGIGATFIAHENREIFPFGLVATGIGGFDSVYTKSFYPFANIPLGVGIPLFDNADRKAYPGGVSSLQIGAPAVRNDTPEVRPSGVSSASPGSPLVKHGTLFVSPEGVLGQAFGSHGVSNNPHFITFSQAVQPDLIGAPTFYGGTQTITIINQFTESIGAALVSYANREIAISGISSLGMTSQHLVKDSEQRFYARPVTGEIGTASLANQDRSILIDGVRGGFGVATVFNSVQYVRMLTPFPVDPQKPGAPTVYNFDREIRPQGVFELNVYPTHSFIAYQNRVFISGIVGNVGDPRVRNNDYYHPLDGVDSLLIGNQRVQNASFGVYASAGDTAQVGSHNVAKSLYRLLDGVSDGAVGSAWLSHSPREIVVSERGVDALSVPSPFISNDPRQIQLSGVGPAPVGYHVFQVRLLTLPLTGFSPTAVGTPAVSNYDMEFTPYAFFPAEVGAARFDLGTRYLQIDGVSSGSVGSPRVSDQTQRIICYGGLGQPVTEQLGAAFFYKVPGDPPANQVVYVSSADPLGIGYPTFPDGRIRPSFYAPTSTVGSPSVRFYGLYPEGIHEDNTADTYHAMVFDRSIYISGVAPVDVVSPNRHDMKHRTIWCTSDITPQIRENHPGNEWEVVDSSLVERNMVGVGAPSLTNQHRAVTPSGVGVAAIGSALFYSYSPYVRPAGIPPPRVGMPTFIWRDNFDLGEFHDGPFTEEIGEHSFGYYVAPGTGLSVRPNGIDGALIPSPRVSNFNQDLLISGIDATGVGYHSINLPLPPRQMAGVDGLGIGTAFISNFIREIEIVGVDGLDNWETIDDFRRRMRVYTDGRRSIQGFSTAEIGSPVIGHASRSILITDFNAGVVPSPVFAIQIGSVGGGQPFATLGDVRIDVVEEGKAKVYGVYPNPVPGPAFIRAIGISGVSGAVGSARFGEPAFGDGVSGAAYGAHVFVLGDNTLHSCGMATRAIAFSGVSAAAVPEPALT